MKQYVVDAFTDSLFKGNQAAVCVMEQWIPDELMLNIAKENNFSETAFTVKENDDYRLRWFTPGGEIDFAGTLPWGLPLSCSIFMRRTRKKLYSMPRWVNLP